MEPQVENKTSQDRNEKNIRLAKKIAYFISDLSFEEVVDPSHLAMLFRGLFVADSDTFEQMAYFVADLSYEIVSDPNSLSKRLERFLNNETDVNQ